MVRWGASLPYSDFYFVESESLSKLSERHLHQGRQPAALFGPQILVLI